VGLVGRFAGLRRVATQINFVRAHGYGVTQAVAT
jgi:hypothetical protein